MSPLHKSLFYILILTIVGALLTYKIVVRAYDGAYGEDFFEARIIKAK